MNKELPEYPYYQCPSCGCTFFSETRPTHCKECHFEMDDWQKCGFNYYKGEKCQVYKSFNGVDW